METPIILRPCPFCGNTEEPKPVWPEYIKGQAYRCGTCNAQGPNCFGDEEDTADSYSRKAWNTRPSPWISVEDRLPGRNQLVYVLVQCEDGIEPELWCYRGRVDSRVHFWMPIPKIEIYQALKKGGE